MIELKRKNTRGTSTFRYRLSGESRLVESQVAKLSEIEKSLFLPFSSEATPDGATELHFDVGRMVPFEEWAKEARGMDELQKLCGHISWSIDACIENGLPLKNIVFDTEQVFYDSWRQAFRFVYLPVTGLEADVTKISQFASNAFERITTEDDDVSAAKSMLASLVKMRDRKHDPLAIADDLRQASKKNCFLYIETPDQLMVNPFITPIQPVAESVPEPEPKQERVIASQPLSAKRKRYPWEEGTSADQGGLSETQSMDAVVISDRPKSEKARANQQKEQPREEPKTGTLSLELLAQQAENLPKGTTVLGLLDEDEFDDFGLDGSFGGGHENVSEETGPECASECDGESALGEADQDAEPEFCPEPGSKSGPELDEGSEGATTLLVPEEQFEYALIRLKTNERIQIPEGRFVIGKSKYSDYRIAGNTTVSRLHAVFERTDEQCWVEDNKSLNGTFVNNAKLAPAARIQLNAGDVVRMSDEDFLFEKVERVEGRR